MSTCNRLDLQTLGSQPVVMPKNHPDHWQVPDWWPSKSASKSRPNPTRPGRTIERAGSKPLESIPIAAVIGVTLFVPLGSFKISVQDHRKMDWQARTKLVTCCQFTATGFLATFHYRRWCKKKPTFTVNTGALIVFMEVEDVCLLAIEIRIPTHQSMACLNSVCKSYEGSSFGW